MTVFPSAIRRAANFPIVVVFPTPLTPTINITVKPSSWIFKLAVNFFAGFINFNKFFRNNRLNARCIFNIFPLYFKLQLIN